jgi:hypothetical protein
VDIAPVLVYSPFEKVVQVVLIGGDQPTTLAEQIGEGNTLPRGPKRAGFDKLSRIDQAGLEGKYTEEQITVGIHKGFQKNAMPLLAALLLYLSHRRFRISCEARQFNNTWLYSGTDTNYNRRFVTGESI